MYRTTIKGGVPAGVRRSLSRRAASRPPSSSSAAQSIAPSRSRLAPLAVDDQRGRQAARTPGFGRRALRVEPHRQRADGVAAKNVRTTSTPPRSEERGSTTMPAGRRRLSEILQRRHLGDARRAPCRPQIHHQPLARELGETMRRALGIDERGVGRRARRIEADQRRERTQLRGLGRGHRGGDRRAQPVCAAAPPPLGSRPPARRPRSGSRGAASSA